MDTLPLLFTAGIFFTAFLSLLGVVFNLLLSPIKYQIIDLKESHKDLKESHKELRESHKDLQQSQRKLQESQRELQESQRELKREVNQKLDKLLAAQSIS